MTEADVTDEVDEWEVDEITNHRIDENGKIWFEKKWSGFSGSTWEPLNHFVHRYSADWAEYCKTHRINANVIDHLLGAKAMIQEVQVHSVRENISVERVGGLVTDVWRLVWQRPNLTSTNGILQTLRQYPQWCGRSTTTPRICPPSWTAACSTDHTGGSPDRHARPQTHTLLPDP